MKGGNRFYRDNYATMAQFGALLRKFRHNAGFTQTEFCYEMGLTQPQLSELENGKCLPFPSETFAIEQKLGLPSGTLSHIVGYAPSDVSMFEAMNNAYRILYSREQTPA